MLCTCALISGVVGNCVFQSCSETLSKAVLKLPKLFKIGYQAAISGKWRYLAVNFVSHLTPIALSYLV